MKKKSSGQKLKRSLILATVVGALGYGCYLGLLYYFYDYNPHFLKIDSCLDEGGCWDRKERLCRKNEPDAQRLCGR